MIEIKTLEIAGMASVLQALRLPFGKDKHKDKYKNNKKDGEKKFD